MKNQQLLKIFIVLILSTAYIFSFSHFGASAYEQLIHVGELGENTKIGNLDVSGKNKKEISEKLVAASEQWKQNTKLEITYKEAKVALSNDIFTFQIDETVSLLKSGQNHIVAVYIDRDALLYQLQTAFISLAASSIDLERLTKDLTVNAQQLAEGNYSFSLENYVNKDRSASTTIAKAKVDVGRSAGQMKELTSLMKSLKIEGQSQFSLLGKVDEITGNSYSSDVLSRLATAIYEVILPTNFTILERNISEELPSYAQLGMEASVNQSVNHDLVFSNTNDMTYQIDLALKGNELEASLIGPSFLNKYEIIKSKEQRYRPKIIKQYNSQLPPNSMTVTETGKEGMAIKVTRKVITSNGDMMKTEELADDFYPPIPRIEVHSLKVIVKPEDLVVPDTNNTDTSNTDTNNPDTNNTDTSNTDTNNPDTKNTDTSNNDTSMTKDKKTSSSTTGANQKK